MNKKLSKVKLGFHLILGVICLGLIIELFKIFTYSDFWSFDNSNYLLTYIVNHLNDYLNKTKYGVEINKYCQFFI